MTILQESAIFFLYWSVSFKCSQISVFFVCFWVNKFMLWSIDIRNKIIKKIFWSKCCSITKCEHAEFQMNIVVMWILNFPGEYFRILIFNYWHIFSMEFPIYHFHVVGELKLDTLMEKNNINSNLCFWQKPIIVA